MQMLSKHLSIEGAVGLLGEKKQTGFYSRSKTRWCIAECALLWCNKNVQDLIRHHNIAFPFKLHELTLKHIIVNVKNKMFHQIHMI